MVQIYLYATLRLNDQTGKLAKLMGIPKEDAWIPWIASFCNAGSPHFQADYQNLAERMKKSGLRKPNGETDQAQIPSLSDDIILSDVIKLLLPELSVSTASTIFGDSKGFLFLKYCLFTDQEI